MASRTGIVILAAAVSTGLLTVFTDGNVIDQKVLQRELAEITPEIVSLNDKDEFRELGEPVAVAAVNDYKTQVRFRVSDNGRRRRTDLCGGRGEG